MVGSVTGVGEDRERERQRSPTPEGDGDLQAPGRELVPLGNGARMDCDCENKEAEPGEPRQGENAGHGDLVEPVELGAADREASTETLASTSRDMWAEELRGMGSVQEQMEFATRQIEKARRQVTWSAESRWQNYAQKFELQRRAHAMETGQKPPPQKKFTILVVETVGDTPGSQWAYMQTKGEMCQLEVQGSTTVGRVNVDRAQFQPSTCHLQICRNGHTIRIGALRHTRWYA